MSTPRSAAPDRTDSASASFARDAADFLTRRPRQVPSRYLYDPLGSALFEAICRLPWYRIAAIEQRILDAQSARIFATVDPIARVVELGPGSGEKLMTLMGAHADRDITVHLVDISAEALSAATQAITARTAFDVVAHEATYETGLRAVAASAHAPGRSLVLFLGSNIGNFDRAGADALLLAIRSALHPSDALLLGTDLVKPEPDLLLAYDDPLGVTAAFNRNLLVRMNRELGADFDLGTFAHRAVWNQAASRIEMHLESTTRQRVRIPAAGLDITFEPGEMIWTESSYKYRAEELAPTCSRAGFEIVQQWVDDGFALTLARAV